MKMGVIQFLLFRSSSLHNVDSRAFTTKMAVTTHSLEVVVNQITYDILKSCFHTKNVLIKKRYQGQFGTRLTRRQETFYDSYQKLSICITWIREIIPTSRWYNS